MNININFYGAGITLEVEDVIEAGGLEKGATKAAIRRAIDEAVERALTEDEFPSYDHDGQDEDFIAEIREALDAAAEE